MKKINRKGFTLIELLAVIVIMAIILIVTVPNIIQSINDARFNSIHNLAVSVANTYDTAYGQDLIASEDNKILGDIPERMTATWTCIGDSKFTSTTGDKRSLADIFGLSSDDVILTATKVPTETTLASISSKSGSEYCSAIRVNNGNAEVILVATNGGRFYIAQYYTYALSTASSAGQNVAK